MALDLGDRLAETAQVGLRDAGQRLHQRQPAEMRGKLGRKRRQSLEGGDFLRSVDAAEGAVEDEQDAPRCGHGQARDDRRRAIGITPPAIERHAAFAEEAGADPRSGAAVEKEGVAFNIERQAVQAPGRRGDSQRKLGAGAQASMGGNGFTDAEPVACCQPELLGNPAQMDGGALGLRALQAIGWAAAQFDNASWLVKRETEAAEPPAQAAVQIEETKMQAGSHRNCHAVPHPQIPVFREAKRIVWASSSPHYVATGFQPVWQRRKGRSTMSERAAERTYSDAEVEERLKRDLPHWRLEGGWIRRKYKTASWKGTLMVINTVGHLAEAAWHHPDITASYAWVEVRLTNHAAKGITDKDFELARKIEEVVQWQPGRDGGALTGTPGDDQRFAYLKYDK
jgi:4a-hydroxytetrahydrobiopterin dehydratase